jgi:hypothetical protein
MQDGHSTGFQVMAPNPEAIRHQQRGGGLAGPWDVCWRAVVRARMTASGEGPPRRTRPPSPDSGLSPPPTALVFHPRVVAPSYNVSRGTLILRVRVVSPHLLPPAPKQSLWRLDPLVEGLEIRCWRLHSICRGSVNV